MEVWIKLSSNKVPIYIPTEIYQEIKNKVLRNQEEFKSIEEFVEFVLREVLKDEGSEQVYTPEEEKEIKKRLKSLGYM